MIRKLLYCLLVPALYSVAGYAQSAEYQTDTSYIGSLLKKGEKLEVSKPTTALQCYVSAYNLAQKIKFWPGYFESVRLYAFALNNVGRHAEARVIATEALRIAQADTSNRYKGISHHAVATTALLEGNVKEAITHYQQAARHMQKIGKLYNVGSVYQNLGLIYEQQHMYTQALDYFNRSLRIHEKDTSDRRGIAIDYFSIGNVYLRQDKYDLAHQYYRKTQQLIDLKKDADLAINIYNNLANSFESHARYDSALYYQQKALRLSQQIKNPRHELHMLMTIGQTYNSSKQYARAKGYLDQAYRIAQETKAGLGEFRNIYRNYVVMNEGLKNYRAAFDWYDKYDTVDDSLNNAEAKELLQSYELKLRQAESQKKIAEKQQRILQLEEDRQRQQLWLLIAILTAVTIGVSMVLGYLYYRQRQRAAANALLATQREHELATIQSEMLGQQKERLRISKEMHDDLGASLTAIGLLSEVMKSRMGTSTTPEVEKISTISADMITTMNEIIWSLNTKNDSLNGLIAYIRAYACEFLENTPLQLRLDIVESTQEINISGTDRRNVFLTLKEALNNAVKHAQATEITLSMKPETHQLVVALRDNGRGFSPDGQTYLRNGLTNMQNRMAESGGSCQITSSAAGTCVTITYPYVPQPIATVPA